MRQVPRTPTAAVTGETWHRHTIVAGLGAVFFVSNLLGPALFWNSNGSYGVTFAIGALVAEIILLAIWCALGTQAIKIRLPLCLGLVVVATCTYIVGLQLPDDELPFEVAIILVVAASAFFACMLAPFWGLRLYARQHIVADHEAVSDQSRSGQFGVRYLLTMTGCVAVLLVLVKLTIPTDYARASWPPWGQFITGGLVYVVFSGCLAIPCVWLALSSQNRSFWASSLAVVLVLGPVIASVIIQYAFGGAAADFWELVFYILSFAVGLVATTSAVLLVLGRLCGFRLSAIRAK